jgi:hypothetical protein
MDAAAAAWGFLARARTVQEALWGQVVAEVAAERLAKTQGHSTRHLVGITAAAELAAATTM